MNVLRASPTLPCLTPRLGRSLISSFPALTLPTWAPGHFSIRELSFGEFFWDQAAGAGATGLPWVWRAEGWMGMLPISTGTLSSTSTAGLELGSKWRPWNIHIKSKNTHTKYIPTTRVGVSRKSRNLHHANRMKRTNKNYYRKETLPQFQIAYHCCASAWNVRI